MRRLITSYEVAGPAQLFSGRNGRSGLSVLVGMPALIVEHPDVPEPDLTVRLPVRVHELRDTNMTPNTGTMIPCETAAAQVLRTLHPLAIEGLCELYAERVFTKPVEEFEGIVSYEVLFKGRLPLASLPRTALPQINDDGVGNVTLVNVTAGAAIYYTTDGTFPGQGNGGAPIYREPFFMATGTVVRWAAYATGMLGSDVGQAEIN